MISWIKSSSYFFVILSVAFVCGWFVGRRESVNTTPSIVTHDVKIEQRLNVQHDVITVETKKPDGTVIKKTIVEEKSAKVFSKDDDVKKVGAVEQKKYQIGVEYLPALEVPSGKSVRVSAGARLGSTNFFLIGGYDVRNSQLSVGVQYQW